MAKIPLSKSKLADKVRDRIRRYRGCDRVDAIVLHEITRPEARWEIAAIVAGTADYDAVRAAAKEVQQQLQALYQITSEPASGKGSALVPSEPTTNTTGLE